MSRFLLPALLLATLPVARAGDATPPLAIDSGPIVGEVADADAGVRAYRGIPFAAPPLGPYRWQPPQPVAPWTQPRACRAFGPACPQPPSPLPGKVGRQDEDCLYLNVWTAAAADAKRPVLFWIHGGGHTIGAGSLPYYDGTPLAREGVVVVTTNYRLGPLGYLAHPALSAESPRQVSGNYGLLDQLAALGWVQRNIARFGGDPGNVTIFGESAGAVSCACLLVSPLAEGLFHRAILESGTAGGVRMPLHGAADSAEAQGLAVAKAAGAQALAELRAKTPAELLTAAAPRVGFLGQGLAFGPIVDGWALPDAPLKLLAAGQGWRVPVIVGTNADEGTFFLHQVPIRRAGGYRLAVRFFFPDAADDVLRLFPPPADGDPQPALGRLLTVTAFVAPARLTARLFAEAGWPTYVYHFTRVAPAAAPAGLGATHGAEIPYVFGNGPRLLATPADAALSATMRRYWRQFATTGEPNGEGLPPWPRFTTANDSYLEFGDPVAAKARLLSAECDLFEPRLRQRLGLPATAPPTPR